MNIKKGVIFVGVLFVCSSLFFSFSSSVFAADDYTLLESIPKGGQADSTTDFSEYMKGLFNFATGFVVVGALLMITIGGFYYVTSAGNQAQAGTAKKIITDALLGLVVVFVTWLILYTINPDLVGSSPSMGKLQTAVNTAANTSTVNKTNITQSGTYCRSTGSGTKCHSSKQECEQSVSPTAISTGCESLQNSFDDSKYYHEDADGNITEMDKDACEAVGSGKCSSGSSVKGNKFASVKTVEQKEATLAEHNIEKQDGVSLEETADKTVLAVVNVGEPACGGECEKKVIGTEGSNIVDVADDSGTFQDSKLLNSIQSEAQQVGDTEIEILPTGGTLTTHNVKRTKTYTYPEGHAQAGQTFQVVQTGPQTKGTTKITELTFAPTTSKIRVFGEKDTPPPAKIEAEAAPYNELWMGE